MVPGDKCSIVDRPASAEDKARFPKHYAAFQGNNEDLVQGTPLETWPQLTRSQVEEMRYFHVRTVEQLAGMIPNLKVELLEPILSKGFPGKEIFKALDNLAETIANKHKEHNYI